MNITFERCILLKVVPSTKKPSRIYLDIVDLESGQKFNFSTEAISASSIMPLVGQTGRLTGKFESYEYTKNGVSIQQFKATSGDFTPEKPAK